MSPYLSKPSKYLGSAPGVFKSSITRNLDTEQGFEYLAAQVNTKNHTESHQHQPSCKENTGLSIDDSNHKYSHSHPIFPIFGSIRESISKGKLHSVFENIKSKLGFGKPTKTARRDKSFQEICFDLGYVESQTKEDRNVVFKTCKLEFKIRMLESTTIKLALPIELDQSETTSIVGNFEEQGSGGTYDNFIGMLPEGCRDISQKASPLGLVPKLLPYGIISKEARYVGSCFWIWLCIVDDLIENLPEEEWAKAVEQDLFAAFSQDATDFNYNDITEKLLKVSLALREVIKKTQICQDALMEQKWRDSLFEATREIITGFREERPLLENKNIAMSDWMKLRVVTISARPFFILARADLGLVPTVSKFGNPLDAGFGTLINMSSRSQIGTLRKVECLLQTILGLQNDIMGWEKDSLTHNPLSAIQILIQKGTTPEAAMTEVVQVHNDLIMHCLARARMVWKNPSDNAHLYSIESRHGGGSRPQKQRASVFGDLFGNDEPSIQLLCMQREENVRNYVKIIIGFANGMAMWMAVSKRYMA